MTPDEITELRYSYGVTQEKFASMLGSTVTSINRWENGKAKPSRMYLKELKQLKAQIGSYLSRNKES